MNEKILQINSNWTSLSSKYKFKHYRISSKKIEDGKVKYELMAILDKSDRFWLSSSDLSHKQDWKPGWI